jgi:hypothetical protein
MSVVSVVCCQVGVSATGWSLVQRSPTECGVSNNVIVKRRKMTKPGPQFSNKNIYVYIPCMHPHFRSICSTSFFIYQFLFLLA